MAPFDAGLPDAGSDDAGAPHDAGMHPDAGPPHDAGTVDAGAPPVIPPCGPLLVPSGSGKVLSDAWLVTLTYPDVPDAGALIAMGDALPGSQWLATVAGEYGAAILGHTHYDVPLVAPAQFADSDVPALVEQGLDAGWWATPDAGTPLWLVIYPGWSQPTTNGFNYTGEHFDAPGKRVVAWVAPHKDAGVDFYEFVAGHEILEALTDPYPYSSPAYRASGLQFSVVGGEGGELGDLCEFKAPIPGPFALPRGWSNAASDAGYNPCVPAPPQLAPWGVIWTPNGSIEMDLDHQVTVALPALSPEGAGTWPLLFYAYGDLDIDLALPATATAGQPVMATVTAPFFVPHGSSATFTIVSTPDGGETASAVLEVDVR
jgi:hypothetical protein